MTHWTNGSSTSLVALAACLGGLLCATPAGAQQLDVGIAPNVKTQPRAPRPSGAGTVLLGNPADPLKTADAAGVNGPSTQQLKNAVPPGYKLDERLEKALTDWEAHTEGVERLNGNFYLYTYDQVFQTDTRAEGQFWYQSPDKGRMDFRPVDLAKAKRDPKTGKLVTKTAPDGSPYEVKAKDWEIWNCTGREILQVFPAKKEYNRIEIPQQYQGESIKDSPLPFLFGLRKAEAKERYLMRLGPKHGTTVWPFKVPSIHVIALPLREQDSREWSTAEVLLDAQTFLPQSIRTVDPAGTSENVYAFSGVEVNAIKWWQRDPFALDVSKLKLILDRSAEPGQNSSIPKGAPAAPANKSLFNLGGPK